MSDEIYKEAEELDKKYNFFVTLAKPETGIPIAIKDNICTKGIQSSAGSEILKGYLPPFDATVISRLKRPPAIKQYDPPTEPSDSGRYFEPSDPNLPLNGGSHPF